MPSGETIRSVSRCIFGSNGARVLIVCRRDYFIRESIQRRAFIFIDRSDTKRKRAELRRENSGGERRVD